MNFEEMKEASLTLLGCPFCGSRPRITIYSGVYTIFCDGCPALMGGEESTATAEELIAAWSSRAKICDNQ